MAIDICGPSNELRLLDYYIRTGTLNAARTQDEKDRIEKMFGSTGLNCKYHCRQGDNMDIKIKYFADIDKLVNVEGAKSDWVDLRCSEDIDIKSGEFKLIPLGVGMKLPDGYEAHIVPRSSTFKNFGIIQTNGIGIIDNKYCGDNDMWMMPAYAIRDTHINKNDRVCQFRLIRNQDPVKFNEVEKLDDTDRGGFGSTGRG